QLHIDLAKEGWRVSNTRNAIPQMTKWLDRQEKIETFRRYVNDQAEENQDPLTRTITLAKQPATIKAKPGDSGQFNMVVVTHSAAAESTGLPGMKVGCLQVIFKLPRKILLSEAPSCWPKEELTYIEWYKVSHTPGKHHNMYTV
ncbi:hypothetical protein SCLCIDRAFT_92867, partial [Scleroderma citrinum Foug A]